jgi:predicted amidophosphoribosyltransferase
VIALVDDVVTTTGTVRESAAALRQAGAREVRVLAIARAF